MSRRTVREELRQLGVGGRLNRGKNSAAFTTLVDRGLASEIQLAGWREQRLTERGLAVLRRVERGERSIVELAEHDLNSDHRLGEGNRPANDQKSARSAMSLTRWVERPLRVVAALDAGEAGGSYYESVMLVASVFSAIAAYVWPGERIDRARFVQAWVDFGSADAKRVSVPLLVAELHGSERHAEAEALMATRPDMFGPGHDLRVLTGAEVDGTEDELSVACSTLDRKVLRRCSYPNIFYEHVRSKLVHEYQLEGTATRWPMSMDDAGISYANPLVSETADAERQIHFSVPWLVALARTMASNAAAAYPNGKARRPDPWWSKA